MIRTLAVAALALPLAAFAAAPPAGRPWEGEPFSADPGAIAAAAEALPAPRGLGAEVLLEEGTYRFEANGAQTFTYRVVVRVVTAEAARALSRLERAWSPWHQAPPDVRVRVISPKGEAAALDPATLTEQGIGGDDPDRFSDRRALVGPLPGVRAGSVIEEVTSVRDTGPAFEGGVTTRFWLGRGGPARLVRLRLEAPASLPLRWVAKGTKLTPVEKTTNGLRTLAFEQRDVQGATRPEPAGPPELPPSPYVAFGWGRSWADVAERYGALADRQLAGADLAGPLAEALGPGPRPDPAKDRDAIVRKVAAWVWQHARYTGLELGDAAIVPARPADTLARRFGDCKDLSLLVLGMLRAAGLQARLALLSTEWHDLTAELPGLGELDHVVVRVDGGPALWLDATDPSTPPGRLPPPIQGKLALVAAPGTKELARTPVSTSADNAAVTVRELHLATVGRGRIVETRTLTGALADGERRFRGEAGPDVDQRYALGVFRAETFLGADVKGADEPAAPLVVRVEADESAAVLTEDDEADLPVTPDSIFQPLLSVVPHGEAADAPPPPPRKTDLLLPLAYRWEVRYRVFPPDGFRPRPLPESGTERFGPATYTRRFAVEADGTITATFSFDTGARRLPAADATALLKRAREVVAGDGPRVKLERTAAALLAAGQVQEGLAELKRLSAAHPREAAHRLHLSVALLQLGMGDAALLAARDAIALEPRRAWAHRVLGYVLEHDAVGRLHGPGFDRDGAIAAYRQARTLDPSHAGGRAALAELLATGADGTRHGPSADLPAALEEYRALRDDLSFKDSDVAFAAADLSAGRFADARALARDVKAGAERNAVLVAAVAASDGAERAAAEAEGLGEDRREALRGAAPWLVRLRRFDVAAALLREAARGAPNAAELRAQADDFSKIRPWEKTRDAGDEAERLAKRLFVVALTEHQPMKAIAPLLSPRVLASDLADVLRANLPVPVASAQQTLHETGMPKDALLDLVLSRLELSRDGDLAKVLRVRMRFPFTPAERGSTAYLVREGGQVRLLATDLAWPILADEALLRAKAGDLATAARLVTWAREDAGPDPDPASPTSILAPLWRPLAGDAPDADAVRRAASALLAFADRKGATIPALEGFLAKAPAGPERRAVALALVRAARSADKAELVLSTAEALLAEDPSLRSAFAAKAWALQRLKRPADLAKAGQAMLARLPGDAEVLSALGASQLLAGDLDGAAATWRQLIDSGQATPLAYNNAAWLELFRGGATPAALDWARRAVDQERGRDNHASLNTLAAVYAELDRPAEAREIFLRSVGPTRPLQGADWYVVGRTAEGFGLTDAARAIYARVQAEPVDGAPDPTDAHVLAQRRLAKLPPASAAPTAAPAPAPAPATAPVTAPAPKKSGKP
ncbi:MAG: DUF3857 domain-containing protein [Anaeromyxobacteraceae bacterium]